LAGSFVEMPAVDVFPVEIEKITLVFFMSTPNYDLEIFVIVHLLGFDETAPRHVPIDREGIFEVRFVRAVDGRDVVAEYFAITLSAHLDRLT
jgi:hypothetical protein